MLKKIDVKANSLIVPFYYFMVKCFTVPHNGSKSKSVIIFTLRNLYYPYNFLDFISLRIILYNPAYDRRTILNKKIITILLNNGHFIDQVRGTGIDIHDPEYVSYIDSNCSLDCFLKSNISAHGFPVTVECQTD